MEGGRELFSPDDGRVLAATTVGFEIGLFSESVVNAVPVLILASVVVSTLVAIADLDAAPLGLRLASAVARRDAGVVDALLLRHPADPGRQAELDRLSGLCRRLGIDTDPEVRVTERYAQTTVHAAHDLDASLVIAIGDAQPWAEAVSLAVPAPVAIVQGTLDRPLRTVRVVASGDGAAGAIASQLAAAAPTAVANAAGEVAIVAVSEGPGRAQQPPEGGALVLVHDALLPHEENVAAGAAT